MCVRSGDAKGGERERERRTNAILLGNNQSRRKMINQGYLVNHNAKVNDL